MNVFPDKSETSASSTTTDNPSSPVTANASQAPSSCEPPNSTNKPFHPDRTFMFPSTLVQKQQRSCQHNWFEKYPWLDYSIAKDAVFCFVCKRQNMKQNLSTERCKEDVFLEKGFKNWKKAIEKFEKHQASKCH